MEIYAEVIFYSTQRTTLPRNGYRPDAMFGDNKDYWGITFLDLPIENFDTWTPASIKFTFQKSHYFEITSKQKFRIMEGSRQVGEGKVISLNKNSEYNKKKETENLILTLWKNEKLPIIEGLLLSNNQFIGDIKANAKKITSFNLYQKNFYHFYSYINITQQIEYENYRIYAGDGSHGSDGYVLVLTKSNDFVWLLFDEINPIEKISVQNGMLYAKNNCDELFILPIDEPFKYRIENREQL